MALLSLAFSLALVVPQGGDETDPRITSALTPQEQAKLNGLARKWFEAEKKYLDESDTKRRIKLNREVSAAREKFIKEWDSKSKKEPLSHVGDLLAVFKNVFPYKDETGSGEIKSITKDGPAFDVVVPKTYNAEEEFATVVLVPPRVGDKWAEARQAYADTWKGVAAASNRLVVMPRLDDARDLDPLPDLTTTAGNTAEMTNIESMFAPIGRAQQMYRFDRNRVILDCGAGSCGFAMRVASYFPGRFAGFILREPVEFGRIPSGGDVGQRDAFAYGSLAGQKVLLIRTGETTEACGRIAKKLNELEEGACEILDADTPDLQAKIAAWAEKVRRDLFRKFVVLEPNHDMFLKSHWVQVDSAETVASGPTGRPYLRAEADHASNRITVTARNVQSFQLLLNDAIVDLDKDVTIVVNGKAVTEKLQRSFQTLTEFLSFTLFDTNRVWTATYRTAVPKSDAPADKTSGEGLK